MNAIELNIIDFLRQSQSQPTTLDVARAVIALEDAIGAWGMIHEILLKLESRGHVWTINNGSSWNVTGSGILAQEDFWEKGG